jgi:hypothetical protein
MPYQFITFEASKQIYNNNLRQEGEPEAVTVGPFNWVQLTYELLRCSPEGLMVAEYRSTGWVVNYNKADAPAWLIELSQWTAIYSDITIHRNPPTREYPKHRIIKVGDE